jgi:phenylacetate-coenzyme A ligase PaaK-like adenylate-forming protein
MIRTHKTEQPSKQQMQAEQALDKHVAQIIDWHFSPETGCDFWLDWAKQQDWDVRKEVRSVADLQRFPHFEDDWLRFEEPQRWVPKSFQDRPYNVFETGGTTGMPKQRIGWDDYKRDYESFGDTLDDNEFPKGQNWLMMGPTGPRRLRLAIEHLANYRGGSCYFLDLDPRWVKKLIANGEMGQAKAYMEHVIDQATIILKHRRIAALFTTPKLLEALSDKISIPQAGIKGVFLGGTEMNPQTIRFLVEEVLEGKVALKPVYGNTLMGLAHSKALTEADQFSVSYYAPQPWAVLRVVDPDATDRMVDYGQWGRVELTTLTKEFFMPRFLERDEAIRRPPIPGYAWDGVGEVRPFGASTQTIVEGVY